MFGQTTSRGVGRQSENVLAGAIEDHARALDQTARPIEGRRHEDVQSQGPQVVEQARKRRFVGIDHLPQSGALRQTSAQHRNRHTVLPERLPAEERLVGQSFATRAVERVVDLQHRRREDRPADRFHTQGVDRLRDRRDPPAPARDSVPAHREHRACQRRIGSDQRNDFFPPETLAGALLQQVARPRCSAWVERPAGGAATPCAARDRGRRTCWRKRTWASDPRRVRPPAARTSDRSASRC